MSNPIVDSLAVAPATGTRLARAASARNVARLTAAACGSPLSRAAQYPLSPMPLSLLPIDESFFESAPLRFRDVMELPLAGQALWAHLVADAAFTWCGLVRRSEWSCRPPFGIGSTRMVWMRGGMRIEERFFRWEDGRRQSFGVESASLPTYRSLGEDYLIEPLGPDSCRFTWTIAARPRPLARPFVPLVGLMTNRLFLDTRRHFGAR